MNTWKYHRQHVNRHTDGIKNVFKDLIFYFLFFPDRVSLYSPGCPGTQCVNQGGLELMACSTLLDCGTVDSKDCVIIWMR